MKKHFAKVDRRDFMKGAAATFGGLAVSQWAFSNYEAAAQGTQELVIFSDIIRGGAGDPTGPTCVETSVFSPGEQVVFRAVVFDGSTGEKLNTTDLVESRGLTMNVEIEGVDEPLEMNHGPHPRDSDDQHFYFAKGYTFPPNASGKIGYIINAATDDGKTGQVVIAGYEFGGVDNDSFPAVITIE